MTSSTGTVHDLRSGQQAVLGEPDVDLQRRRRLAELGLRAGETVTLIQRGVGGARIVAVRESRIALDARTSALLPIVGEQG